MSSRAAGTVPFQELVIGVRLVIVSETPTELVQLGYQARREGRPQKAREFFAEAVELCRRADNPSLLAASLTGLGQIERDLRNKDAALQYYREAVALYRLENEPLRLAHTIRHLADIYRGGDALDSARPLYEEALAIYRQSPETSPLDLANAIRGFALLRGMAGEKEGAVILWREARALYESVEVQAGVQESDTQIARLTN